MSQEPLRKRWILFLLAASFLLRIFIFFIFIEPNKVHIKWGDASAYIPLAQNIARGAGFVDINGKPDTLWFPGYPYLLAFLFKIGNGSYRIAAIIQIGLSCLVPVLIYQVAQRLFDIRTALIASAISIFYPLLIFSSSVFSWYLPLILSLLLVVSMSVNMERHQYVKTACLALLTGAAFLIHPEFLFLFPLMLIWLAIKFKRQGARLGKLLAVYVLIFGLAILPWYLRNYRLYGKFILEPSLHGGLSLYQRNNEFADGRCPNPRVYKALHEIQEKIGDMDEIEKDKYYYKLALGFILNNPGKFFLLCLERALAFWAIFPRHECIFNNIYVKIVNLGTYGALLPFILIGFFVGLKYWEKRFLIYALILIKMGIHTVTVSGIGYRLAIDPFLIILGALGITHILRPKQKLKP